MLVRNRAQDLKKANTQREDFSKSLHKKTEN